MNLIESMWDELVRVAASVQTGQCTAVQLLPLLHGTSTGV